MDADTKYWIQVAHAQTDQERRELAARGPPAQQQQQPATADGSKPSSVQTHRAQTSMDADTIEFQLLCIDPDTGFKYYVSNERARWNANSPFDLIWIKGQTEEGHISQFYFRLPWGEEVSMEAMNEAWPPKPCQVCHPGARGHWVKAEAINAFYQRAPPNSKRRHNLVKTMVNSGHATNYRGAVTNFLTSSDHGELSLNNSEWDNKRKRQTRTSSEFPYTELHAEHVLPKPASYISSDFEPQNAYVGLDLGGPNEIFNGKNGPYWDGYIFLSGTRINSEEHEMLMKKSAWDNKESQQLISSLQNPGTIDLLEPDGKDGDETAASAGELSSLSDSEWRGEGGDFVTSVVYSTSHFTPDNPSSLDDLIDYIRLNSFLQGSAVRCNGGKKGLRKFVCVNHTSEGCRFGFSVKTGDFMYYTPICHPKTGRLIINYQHTCGCKQIGT